VNKPSAETVFWLVALVYAVLVMLIIVKTAPGDGNQDLAVLAAIIVTLPTSLVLMFFVGAMTPLVFGAFIFVMAASALVNIGFAWAILFGLERDERKR
jgi:hypothetical protein